jgi:predicted nucleic acid-binding protein
VSGRPAFLVDTAVFAYALGGDHPMKRACGRAIAAAGDGHIELHASTELIQELVFHRMRKTDRPTAVRQARDVATVCVLHDFDEAVLYRALELIAMSESMGGRDAVHAATALHHGLPLILSPDRDFDAVVGLRRIDPADALSP